MSTSNKIKINKKKEKEITAKNQHLQSQKLVKYNKGDYIERPNNLQTQYTLFW